MQKLYPANSALELSKVLIGNRRVSDELKAGEDLRVIQQNLLPDIAEFMNRRRPFLLY